MKKILIVDGLDPFIREEKDILSRNDFHIFTTKSGREALEIHRREMADFILADLNAPDLAGDELAKAVRLDPSLKRVSIVIVTSLKRADLERCACSGANDYITRPIDPEKLLGKVAHLIDVPRRGDLRVLIKARLIGSIGQEPFFGTTCNISVSGLLLETEKVLAKADLISCSFFIPDAERVSAKGEVVRVTRQEGIFHYGVRFVELPEWDTKIIETYVRRHMDPNAT
ncbi:MAG: response regulator [Nitrospiraceae bacterium]|nr:response regulator [Nitrospiraceae bacterium]